MDANYWPVRLTIHHGNGNVRTEDYSETFGGRPIAEYARHLSTLTDVTRVDLATSFVAGEQVTPTTTEV